MITDIIKVLYKFLINEMVTGDGLKDLHYNLLNMLKLIQISHDLDDKYDTVGYKPLFDLVEVLCENLRIRNIQAALVG